MALKLGNIELNRKNVALGILFLIGLCIFMYPFVNNWFYQNIANDEISSYEQTIDPQKKAEYDKAFKEARKSNKILVGQVVPDVFAIREGTTDKEYESYLNVMGNGMMGVIDIPAIDVHLPIYHYSTADTLLKGCGHIFGSSLPVGGKSSHAVITAHRGLPQAKMFSDLDQMVVGDKFYLKILDQTLAYEVESIETVKPSETRSLAIEANKDLVTLVTCTPYGVNTDRLLVHGHRVPYDPGDENALTSWRPFGVLMKIAVAGAGVLLAILLLWLYSRMRRKDHAKAAAGRHAGGPVDAGMADATGMMGMDGMTGVAGVPDMGWMNNTTMANAEVVDEGMASRPDDLDERIAKARHRA